MEQDISFCLKVSFNTFSKAENKQTKYAKIKRPKELKKFQQPNLNVDKKNNKQEPQNKVIEAKYKKKQVYLQTYHLGDCSW